MLTFEPLNRSRAIRTRAPGWSTSAAHRRSDGNGTAPTRSSSLIPPAKSAVITLGIAGLVKT